VGDEELTTEVYLFVYVSLFYVQLYWANLIGEETFGGSLGMLGKCHVEGDE
jgi:hypothetical protein